MLNTSRYINYSKFYVISEFNHNKKDIIMLNFMENFPSYIFVQSKGVFEKSHTPN